MSGGLPTSLSPRPPGTTGAGGEGRVLVVLHRLGILLQGVLLHLGTLLQGVLLHLGTLLVVLPREVVPIRMGFLVVRSFFHVYLEGLLSLV
jgi:hypothetical protein